MLFKVFIVDIFSMRFKIHENISWSRYPPQSTKEHTSFRAIKPSDARQKLFSTLARSDSWMPVYNVSRTAWNRPSLGGVETGRFPPTTRGSPQVWLLSQSSTKLDTVSCHFMRWLWNFSSRGVKRCTSIPCATWDDRISKLAGFLYAHMNLSASNVWIISWNHSFSCPVTLNAFLAVLRVSQSNARKLRNSLLLILLAFKNKW